MLSLRYLEIFHMIMTSDSLTDAARKLNVSQPAVSAALKHMESQLGYALFERAAGRLTPTREARILFDELDGALAHIRNVQLLARSLAERQPARLCIMAPTSVCSGLLPAAVKALRQDWPEVTVQLRAAPSPEIAQRVLHGQADLGIGYGLSPLQGLEVTRGGHSTVACVMRPDHPLAAGTTVAPGDLGGHTITSYEATMPIGMAIARWFRDADVRPVISTEVSSSASACQMVEQDGDIALVDRLILAEGQFANLIERPLAPPIALQFDFAQVISRRPSRLAERFMAIVRASAPVPEVQTRAIEPAR